MMFISEYKIFFSSKHIASNLCSYQDFVEELLSCMKSCIYQLFSSCMFECKLNQLILMKQVFVLLMQNDIETFSEST